MTVKSLSLLAVLLLALTAATALAVAIIYLYRYLSRQLRPGGCTDGLPSRCGCCAAAKDCGHSNIKEA